MSDLHIGFRQFDRLGAGGRNQRELDVADTFARTIDKIIAIAPDVVLVAGDLFHFAKPSPFAIVTAFNGFSRLMRALPETVTIFSSGNHDIPKSMDAGSIMPLFEELGVHVADRASKRFYFPDSNLSVLAVPDAPNLARPELKPDPRARYNCLCLHGEVQGMLPPWKGGDRAVLEVTNEEIGVESWSLVALGHWHMYRQLAPNMAYSGSIDFTSSNPWQEISVPKCIVERDLETGTQILHPTEPSRRFIDLPAIDAHGMTVEDLNAAIAERTTDVKDAVVRLVIENIDKPQSNALDYRLIRSLRAKALNFALTLRKPELVPRERIADSYEELRQRSLPDILAERIGRRELPADVDRAALQALAQRYLDMAGENLTEHLAGSLEQAVA